MAAADVVASVVGVEFERTAVEMAPWHPGRCAALSVDAAVVGYAGELHPSVVKAFGLPPRTVAAELDLDALLAHFPGAGSVIPISGHPVAKEDIALVVDEDVAVESIKDAVEHGAGELLESCALFDIYRGDPVPEGKKSLAIAGTLQPVERNLNDAEIEAVGKAEHRGVGSEQQRRQRVQFDADQRGSRQASSRRHEKTARPCPGIDDPGRLHPPRKKAEAPIDFAHPFAAIEIVAIFGPIAIARGP